MTRTRTRGATLSAPLLGMLLAMAMVAAACTGGGDEGSATPAVVGCTGDDCSVPRATGVANCVGRHSGTYEGANAGAVDVVLGADGTVVATAFPGLTTAYGPDGLVELRDESGQVADDSALAVSGSSTVGDDGAIVLETPEGLVLDGSFDWLTCSGAGEWTLGPLAGEWTVAQDATRIAVADGACTGVAFTGTAADVRVGPDEEASADGSTVTVADTAATIGTAEIALDTVCLSQAIAGGAEAAFDDVDTTVTVTEGAGFTSYRLATDGLFDSDSAATTSEAPAVVETVIASIEERFPDGAVHVLGHTDAIGGAGYNLELSTARATSIAAVLSADSRTADRTLEITGLGESSPVAEDTTAAGVDEPSGRAANRRVEIVVITG